MSIGLPDATGAEPWQGNGEVTRSPYFVNRKEPAFSRTAVIETVVLQRSRASVGSLLPFSHCSTEKRGHPTLIGAPLFSKQNEAGSDGVPCPPTRSKKSNWRRIARRRNGFRYRARHDYGARVRWSLIVLRRLLHNDNGNPKTLCQPPIHVLKSQYPEDT